MTCHYIHTEFLENLGSKVNLWATNVALHEHTKNANFVKEIREKRFRQELETLKI